MLEEENTANLSLCVPHCVHPPNHFSIDRYNDAHLETTNFSEVKMDRHGQTQAQDFPIRVREYRLVNRTWQHSIGVASPCLDTWPKRDGSKIRGCFVLGK